MIKKLKELHELQEAAGRAVMASANLGKWLSAALNDKSTCQEMKDDIQEWFSAGEPVSILVSLIIHQLEQAEKMREENEALRNWSFNYIDTLLLYVSHPEDSDVKEAVEFANIIADGRKLRMAHLQGSGWHPARDVLSQAKGDV